MREKEPRKSSRAPCSPPRTIPKGTVRSTCKLVVRCSAAIAKGSRHRKPHPDSLMRAAGPAGRWHGLTGLHNTRRRCLPPTTKAADAARHDVCNSGPPTAWERLAKLNACTRNSGQLAPGAGESSVAVRCCAYRRREAGFQHASSARDERRRPGPASDLPLLCGCATSHPDRLC